MRLLLSLLILQAFAIQKQKGPALCIKVVAEPACSSCKVLQEPFTQAFHRDFIKHDYELESKKSEALEGGEMHFLKGNNGFEQVVSTSHCKNILYVQLTLDRTADEGEDEERMRVESFLELKAGVSQKIKAVAHADSSLVVDSDLDDEKVKTITSVIDRIVSDQTAELLNAVETKKELKTTKLSFSDFQKTTERYVKLEGIESYAIYDFFKKTVISQMPQVKLEERMMSKGQIQFAITSDEPLATIASDLQQIKWQEMKLQIVQQTPNEIVVTLQRGL